MPLGRCSECGLEGALGPGLQEGEAFLCCDCDVELHAYSHEERLDPVSAGLARGRRAGAGAREGLRLEAFDAEGSGRPLQLLTDPDNAHFAGVGTVVWCSAAPLARAALELLRPVGRCPVSVLELGAGCGAAGLWLWRECRPRLRLWLTDVPRLCHLLEANAEVVRASAEGSAEPAESTLQVAPLRWAVEEDLASFAGGSWDLVIGADVCYSAEKVSPLLGTIAALQPRLGALFCIASTGVQAPGAAALEEGCCEAGWTWEELRREEAVCPEGQVEVMVVRLWPPSSGAGEVASE